MKESYREGVANYPGAESCGGGREAVPEALSRGICKLGIELRNRAFRKPTASDSTESNWAARANASASLDQRSRRP